MRLSIPSRRLFHHTLAATLVCSGIASAQESKLDTLRRTSQEFGLDTATFRRQFGTLFDRRQSAPRPSKTVEELADQVSQIRLFLTAQANVVVGEIVIAGRTALTEITVPLEQGPVKFSNTGEAPDRTKGDSIFTAQFRMETAPLWRTIRGSLAPSAQTLAAPDARRFVRRGPRDIVPARRAVEQLRTRAPETFRVMSDRARVLTQLAEAPDPLAAARIARVDITRTPFLTLPPRPSLDPRLPFEFRRVFDIPILPIFPIPAPPVPIDETKSLMIVHPQVVEDGPRTFDVCTGNGTPGGAWSFGHLMREMSHGTGMTPEEFTQHWLSTWIFAQEANGFLVDEPGRGAELMTHIMDSWKRASGATLTVDRFPARLLAIVNRPDLADRIGYGVAGSAGEGRLVFGLLEQRDPLLGGGCVSLPFTVIFEYGIKGGSCPAVKAWHQRWKDLETHALGSAAYNAALELITRDFTDHGTNPSQSPNQSSLNQLRTNEIALGSPWQLREFRLQSAGAVPPGLLDLVTVKQTPDDGFLNGFVGTPTVAAYILANENAILNDRHVVPERFPGVLDRFLGAKSDVPSASMFWNAPGLTNPPLTDPVHARRKFSLGTCNACHGGETRTRFTHIGNNGTRAPGSPASLSRFLTGVDVPLLPNNPSAPDTAHYHDLAEREDRMSDILTSSCFRLLALRRIPFVH